VVELVDTLSWGGSGETRVSSSLTVGTSCILGSIWAGQRVDVKFVDVVVFGVFSAVLAW